MTRSYKLLGSLEIEENGRPAPLMKSKKGCAIHAYLIVQGEEKPRAELANLLWKSSTKNSRLGNLRRILGLIRQIAPELVVTRQTLAFQSSATTQVDYQQLQTALLQAKTDQLKTDQLQQLDQGLQQYKGDLLATFYLEDAPNFNEWLTVAREQLRGQVWDAYQRLCAAYFEGQTWEAGIAAARRWVQLDDLHEASHRWLIRFLLANGQHDAAQTQLETCRERLWEELGVEPEDETEALAEQLEASRAKTAVSPTPFIIPAPSAAWQPEPLPDPAKLADLGNLPPLSFLPYQREDNFTGRQDDLIQLGQRLLPWDVPPQSPPKGRKLAPLPLGGAGGGKAVAITGMGGLGKTQLAVEFAHRYGRFFEGGVYWLSFAEPESVPEAVAAIGGESGMRLFRHIEKLTLGDQIGRVQQAWQAPKPRLLIFDNCEDETLFEKWRPVSGGCRVLLTSRRNAWAPELDIAHFPLQSLPRAESIALLKQMLAGKISTAAAAAIAAEVGDLPLALHMAGRFLQRFPQIDASRYLTQLREQTPLSHPSLAGDAAPSGRGVARTFALNFEQLMVADEVNAVAQRLLIHAACFAPGEPIPQQLLLGSLGDDEDDFMAELLAEDGLFRLGSLGFVEAKGQDVVVVHRLIAAFVQDAFAKAENATKQGCWPWPTI
ncbi:MAG: BTAD domain-containing putative transcriptional regulator [Chloroflexota bacterium]